MLRTQMTTCMLVCWDGALEADLHDTGKKSQLYMHGGFTGFFLFYSEA